MVADSIPLLQLMQTKGIGARFLARVLDQLEREHMTLHDFVALDATEIVDRFGLKEEQAAAILNQEEKAVQLADMLESNNVRMILRDSALYPTRLKTVLADKAPPVLFVAGTADLLRQRSVGFCGSRDASPEALRCAGLVAHALAQHGLVVVSGHAQGVDETAHRTALEAGTSTTLVLPEGILHFRPRPSLADLLDEGRFAVVSEFPPKLPWSVANAMQRNRTICGLVHALVVIEAGTSGGTWEAGLAALALGVPLFVLDFAQPAPSGQGNPLLLKRGGERLPCSPGGPPDLSLLLLSLDLAKPRTKAGQPGLFDHLGEE